MKKRLKKAVVGLGFLSSLLLGSPSFAEEPLKEEPSLQETLLERKEEEKEDFLEQDIFQEREKKEIKSSKEEIKISPKNDGHQDSPPRVEVGFHLNLEYTLLNGYTLNFNGLQKENSSWRWSLADNEFYYEHVPIRATFDSVNGFNTDYRDLITVDDELLGDLLTASPAQLQETWERSYPRLRDALKEIYVPKYIGPFTDSLAGDFHRRFQGNRDQRGDITAEGYSLLPAFLVWYVQHFYATEVSPEDQKKTEEPWNEFRQEWRETLPKFDQDALLVHPLQRIKVGSATLEDWLTLFQGSLEFLHVVKGDNFVLARGSFFGEGDAQNELFYRLQDNHHTFTHLISSTAWIFVQGYVSLSASFGKGIPLVELAEIEGLFPNLEEQRIEVPYIEARGVAGFEYKRSLTLARVFEYRTDESFVGDIFGVGFLDSHGFYNDEWGSVTAAATLDTEKREIRASYRQLWDRKLWRTQTQLGYVYWEANQDLLSSMLTLGIEREKLFGFSQRRRAVFEGFLTDEGKYDSTFTYEDWIDVLSHSRALPKINILLAGEGEIFSPMMGYFLFPEQRVLIGNLLQIPYFSSFVTGTVQHGPWLYALPGQEEKFRFTSEHFLALDNGAQKAYRTYVQEQQRLLVLPRLEIQQELLKGKAKLYQALQGLAVLAETKNQQGGLEFTWGFSSSLFVSAMYSTTAKPQWQRHAGRLLLGNEDFLLSAQYGRRNSSGKFGEEFSFSFAAPLSSSVHFTLDMQPLYNIPEEDYAVLSFSRDENLNDFRLMARVGGEF